MIALEKEDERSANGVLSTALRMAGAMQDPALPLPLPPSGGLVTLNFGVQPNNGIVRDAPFSGEMVFENIQTLADGNRIVNRSSTMIYRDSQGRTRHEYSFKLPDPSGVENKEHRTVQIFDPVSSAGYSLDPQNRTAHKFSTFARPNDLVTFNKVEGASTQVTVSGGVSRMSAAKRPQPSHSEATITAMPPVAVGSIGAVSHIARSINAEGKIESLGKQMIEGVEADGTRITQTFPAGAIGNERPIEVIHEHWYSQELQMQVLTKSVDPRWGESTQRLTKINRSEPEASLFQVPSDYTIHEAPVMHMMKEESERLEMKLREKSRKPNEQ
ncbi:MAG: hypothetical protein MOB07_05590 [Acidobacteria bacterium]|nr:hypothetical protein [Acidobacteriota bacterium]